MKQAQPTETLVSTAKNTAKGYYDRSKCEAIAGRWKHADIACDLALKSSPDPELEKQIIKMQVVYHSKIPELLHLLAMDYNKNNEFEEAIICCKVALTNKIEDQNLKADIIRVQANTHANFKQYDEAVECCKKVLDLKLSLPQIYVDSLHIQAGIYMRLSQYNNCVSACKHALTYNASNSTLCNMHVEILCTQATTYTYLMRFQDAIISCEQAMKYDPSDNNIRAKILTIQALAYHNLKNFELAIEFCEKAIECNSSDQNIKNTILQTRIKSRNALNQFEDTFVPEADFAKCDKTTQADFLYIQARKYNQENKFNEVINKCAEALAYKTFSYNTQSKILHLQANAYIRVEKYAEALSTCIEALKCTLLPDQEAQILTIQARAYSCMNQYDKALSTCTKALEKYTILDIHSKAEILYQQVAIYFSLEKYEEALSCCNNMLARDDITNREIKASFFYTQSKIYTLLEQHENAHNALIQIIPLWSELSQYLKDIIEYKWILAVILHDNDGALIIHEDDQKEQFTDSISQQQSMTLNKSNKFEESKTQPHSGAKNCIYSDQLIELTTNRKGYTHSYIDPKVIYKMDRPETLADHFQSHHKANGIEGLPNNWYALKRGSTDERILCHKYIEHPDKKMKILIFDQYAAKHNQINNFIHSAGKEIEDCTGQYDVSANNEMMMMGNNFVNYMADHID
jgi:tetratricopeptide (TPR) repeat protein